MNKSLKGAIKITGLRKKILLSMVFLLLLLGLSTAFITGMILFKVLKTQFQYKGLSHAKSVAANSLVDVLTQNSPRLRKLVENEKKLDADTAYIFIVDSSNRVLAHTFKKGFPVELINANSLPKDKDSNMQLLNTQMGLIYDIDAPVLLDKSAIGHVRLGILQNNIQRTIIFIGLVIMIATLLIIMLGILLAFRISSLITKPISKLAEATRLIQEGDFSAKAEVSTNDEIGLLAAAFNKMAAYLNHMVKEVERLTKYKERERIAFDLHDTCAQDLAYLIKRLEFCEKLFKKEPEHAFEELSGLKDTTRGVLNRIRHIIHELNSPQDQGSNLVERIKGYVTVYQQHNEVTFNLDISESLICDIPSDKSRNIFYIITEALTNIKKHARAKNVELRLGCNDLNEMIINIKDDGKGFDIQGAEVSATSRGNWGLMGMRQRAISLGGSLSMTSIPNIGTQILVNVPLNDMTYSI